MILIVGLGNPGKKFKNTRHNIGFSVLDLLVEKKDWKKSKSGHCFYFKKQISDQIIEFIKPLTFMNSSGKTVKYAIKKHYLKPKDLVVIHDDIDLILGTIRISQNISSAGHKGVQSIINEIGTKNFTRIRIGIKPDSEIPNSKLLKDFVLKKFSKKEQKVIKKARKSACRVIEIIINQSAAKAIMEIQRLNQENQNPRG